MNDSEEAAAYWDKVVWLPDGRALSSADLLKMKDEELREILALARAYRYDVFSPDLWDAMDIGPNRNLKGKVVLEYGCGAGHDGVTMGVRGAKVFAFDNVHSNAELAERYGTIWRVEVLALRGDDPRIGRMYADMVYCYGVLHHIRDPERVLAMFHQVLKKEGRLSIMLYHAATDEERKKFGPEGPYTTTYTREEAVALVEKAGFRVHVTRLFHGGQYLALHATKV